MDDEEILVKQRVEKSWIYFKFPAFRLIRMFWFAACKSEYVGGRNIFKKVPAERYVPLVDAKVFAHHLHVVIIKYSKFRII